MLCSVIQRTICWILVLLHACGMVSQVFTIHTDIIAAVLAWIENLSLLSLYTSHPEFVASAPLLCHKLNYSVGNTDHFLFNCWVPLSSNNHVYVGIQKLTLKKASEQRFEDVLFPSFFWGRHTVCHFENLKSIEECFLLTKLNVARNISSIFPLTSTRNVLLYRVKF